MTDLTVLDAWLDGEPVSPDVVEALLATPEGRVYAVDVMALRCALRADVPVAPMVTPQSRWKQLAAVAAVAVLTATAGYVAGHSMARDDAGAAVPVTAATPGAAPAPTRVIQFEVGVDWSESAGGN